jgi:hypothetical protein
MKLRIAVGGVKDRDVVLLDQLPPAVGEAMAGLFVHEAGHAQDQRVNNIAVAGDPARVGGAPVAILFFDVKDILQREAICT